LLVLNYSVYTSRDPFSVICVLVHNFGRDLHNLHNPCFVRLFGNENVPSVAQWCVNSNSINSNNLLCATKCRVVVLCCVTPYILCVKNFTYTLASISLYLIHFMISI